jgi:hypothetical protein
MSKFRVGLYAFILVLGIFVLGYSVMSGDMIWHNLLRVAVLIPFSAYMLWKFGFNPSIGTKQVHIKSAQVEVGYWELVDQSGKVVSDEEIDAKVEDEDFDDFLETLEEMFIPVAAREFVPAGEPAVYRLKVAGEVQVEKYAIKEIKVDDFLMERAVKLPKKLGFELEFKGRRRGEFDQEFEPFDFESYQTADFDLKALVVRGTDESDYKQIWGDSVDIKRTRKNHYKIRLIVVGVILVAAAGYYAYYNL